MSQKNAKTDNMKQKKQMEDLLREAENDGLDLSQIEDSSSGLYQSMGLLLVTMASLQAGYIYTAILCQCVAYAAFNQLATLQNNEKKESNIMIQSKPVQLYLYYCVQFAVIPVTWLHQGILYSQE